MKTGGIREKDAKGRHTTAYRNMIELSSGVIVIDTPGMREIGLVMLMMGWMTHLKILQN